MDLFWMSAILCVAGLCQQLTADTDLCGCCPEPCCCHCVNVGDISTTPQPPTTTTPDCQYNLDVVYVIDDSGSIGPSDWEIVKHFFVDVLGGVDEIGENYDRVSVVTFSTNASIQWTLDSDIAQDKELLVQSLLALPQYGGLTNTPEALQAALGIFTNKPESRQKFANTVVLMTDGTATLNLAWYEDIANKLKEIATVLVVGAGSYIDLDELIMIASSDRLVFTVNDFQALLTTLNQSRYNADPCPDPPTSVTSPAPTPRAKDKDNCFCCCPPPNSLFGKH